MGDDDKDKTLRASLVAWLRWHAPSAAERRGVPDACLPLLDAMARASGVQAVARLATEIQNAERDLAAMRAQRDEARALVRRYVEGDCLYDELNEERACNAVLRWDEEEKKR